MAVFTVSHKSTDGFDATHLWPSCLSVHRSLGACIRFVLLFGWRSDGDARWRWRGGISSCEIKEEYEGCCDLYVVAGIESWPQGMSIRWKTQLLPSDAALSTNDGEKQFYRPWSLSTTSIPSVEKAGSTECEIRQSTQFKLGPASLESIVGGEKEWRLRSPTPTFSFK